MSALRAWRLTERAFVDGAVREPGYEFEHPAAGVPSRHVQGPGGSVVDYPQAIELKGSDYDAYQARRAEEDRRRGELGPSPAPPLAPQPEPPPKRYRLTAQAFMDGAIREPGYEFDLPVDDKGNEIRGPHRSIRRHHDRIDATTDNIRINGEVVDEPLYEEIAREEPDGPRPVAGTDAAQHARPIEPGHAEDGARAEDRGAEIAPAPQLSAAAKAAEA